MADGAVTGELSEAQFAALVDALAGDPVGRPRLTELLREDHPVYAQRGAATTVRMRGWILLALARAGVTEADLLFVLEELDAGVDVYLVAAAARALRSYPSPAPPLAPFVTRALANVRYRDEPVSFAGYGEYAVGATGTTPVRELLATLAWLGPHARDVLAEVESLREQPGGLPRKLQPDLERAVDAIRSDDRAEPSGDGVCCAPPESLGEAPLRALGSRCGCEPVEATVFEDHDGGSITFGEFFRGQPSIVVFFYTRCDNPLKCSLTVTKLGRVQELLASRGLDGRICTAAITYDPAYDIPRRLHEYGRSRGVHLDRRHRMLRATEGFDALRAHFALGVNFIGSLVNRHRIEAYVLDARGRIAASFERIRWDERQIVDRAAEVLEEEDEAAADDSRHPPDPPSAGKAASATLGTLAALGLALLPKCPLCWAGYVSMAGVAGLGTLPPSPWLRPALAAVLLVNLASLRRRGRATGRMTGFYLAAAGALALLTTLTGLAGGTAAALGVASVAAGSMLGVLGTWNRRAGRARGARRSWAWIRRVGAPLVPRGRTEGLPNRQACGARRPPVARLSIQPRVR